MSAQQTAQALDEIATALARFTDDKQRLAVLGTIALVTLRDVTRQQAVDWLDTLFASLEPPA